jgi:CBS domain-containing protein
MPANSLVRDVMTTALISTRADASVNDAADVLAENGIAALLVLDDDGRLAGVLRDDDLIVSEARVHVPTFFNFLGLGVAFPGEMKHLEHELKKIAGASVGDVMQTDPPTVAPDATLEDVATLMHDNNVHMLPVVDGAGKVVGVIARADLVRDIARTT